MSSHPSLHPARADLLPCEVRVIGASVADQPPSHAVIWLHGLGADGHDFVPIVAQLKAAAAQPVRFVFPHAPVRPVTINGGAPMRAWYDIAGFDLARDLDGAGIAQSVAQVNALIDHQIEQGIAAHRIVLAGFSQGGALALRCGLARPQALAGVMALSAYLLQATDFSHWASEQARACPVFIGHGEHDPVVPVAMGRQAAVDLRSHGLAVHWQTWPMPHSVCMEEVAALDEWLAARWANGQGQSEAGT